MTHGLDINKKEPQVVRIPFMDETDLRPGQEGSFTKDRFFLNGYFEPLKNPLTSEVEFHFIKRPGTGRQINVGLSTKTGNNFYFWKKTNKPYAAMGTSLFTTGIGD